jgi:hypothetical protein
MNTIKNEADDHEASMARADLYKMAKYSMKLFQMIQEGQELEGWVQAKITKASEYVSSIYHYMEYEMKFKNYEKKIESSDIYSEDIKKEFRIKLNEAKSKLKKLKNIKSSKPDFLDLDKDGDKKEPMKKAATDKKKGVAEGEYDPSWDPEYRPKRRREDPDAWKYDRDSKDDSPPTKRYKPNDAEKSAEIAHGKEKADKLSAVMSTQADMYNKIYGKKNEGVSEGVEIVDQGYDMEQQIFKLRVDGKPVSFTYWDYDENWANPDMGEIHAQVKDKLKGLSKEQQKAVAKAVYRAVKQDSLKEQDVSEATGDYSAKKARAGKDIGKPGKQFAKIAKSAGEKYGSKERGEKVAGAVLSKLRGKSESVEEGANNKKVNTMTKKIKKDTKK